MSDAQLLLGLVAVLLAGCCWLLYAVVRPIWGLARFASRWVEALKYFYVVSGAVAGGAMGRALAGEWSGSYGSLLLTPIAACAGGLLVMFIIACAEMDGMAESRDYSPRKRPRWSWLRPFHFLPPRPRIVLRVLGVALSVPLIVVGARVDDLGHALPFVVFLWILASNLAQAVQSARRYIQEQRPMDGVAQRHQLSGLPDARNPGLRVRIARVVWGL